MMYRMFASAIAAGVLAAVLITALQSFTTLPMIMQAETFETPAPAMNHGSMDMDNTDNMNAHGDGQAWAPENGIERLTATLAANCATGIAFALLLVIGLTMGERKADLTKALLLAAGGFAAFTLAPSLGLPPELPGMPGADLVERQIWWAVTVGAALGALACFVYAKPAPVKLLGVVLLIAPHVWGPPPVTTDASAVPALLAAHFAASSIALNAVFWGMLGLFSAQAYAWFSSRA